jgi:hypothetical protein
VLATALLCGSCADSPELARDRAETLQQSVLAVTQAAAESRWADAQSLLAETRTALDTGADAGEVSTERYRQIDAALDQVAADLTAQQAAADQAAAEQAAADQAAAEQAAAEQAAAEKAAADEVAPQPGPQKGKPKNPGKGPGGK